MLEQSLPENTTQGFEILSLNMKSGLHPNEARNNLRPAEAKAFSLAAIRCPTGCSNRADAKNNDSGGCSIQPNRVALESQRWGCRNNKRHRLQHPQGESRGETSHE